MSTRLPIALLCSLLVLVPAALAAPNAAGDGVLELRDVNAWRATIQAKGAIWGQLDKGTLRVTDPNLDDNLTAFVSGAEQTRTTLDPGVTIYSGKNIHFRFSGGRYSFTIVGTGIDLTAVGTGKAWLTGDPEWFDDGDYAVDDGKWQPVPLFKKLVTFGVQSAATP